MVYWSFIIEFVMEKYQNSIANKKIQKKSFSTFVKTRKSKIKHNHAASCTLLVHPDYIFMIFLHYKTKTIHDA